MADERLASGEGEGVPREWPARYDAGDVDLRAVVDQFVATQVSKLPCGDKLPEEQRLPAAVRLLPFVAGPGEGNLRVGTYTGLKIYVGHGNTLDAQFHHKAGQRSSAAKAVLDCLETLAADWNEAVAEVLATGGGPEEDEILEEQQEEEHANGLGTGTPPAPSSSGSKTVPTPAHVHARVRGPEYRHMQLESPAMDRGGSVLPPRPTEGTPGKALQQMRAKRHAASARAVAKARDAMVHHVSEYDGV